MRIALGESAHRIAGVIFLALAVVLTAPSPTSAGPPSEIPALVVLVRHGETTGTGPDRALSEVGRARAEALAELLADDGVDRILSSDYRRTRQTAAPLARRVGIETEIYDASRLEDLARDLSEARGTVVVVGHSNTTPELVVLLGGEPGPPIAEDEHDRLYRVEVPKGATTVERYRPVPVGESGPTP